MSRYIDAEALTAEFHRLTLGENSLIERLFADGVYAVIDTFPSADVAPIVHAHWIKVEKYPPFYKCSNCNVWVKPQSYFIQIFSYCPNCGAKMDEETENKR